MKKLISLVLLTITVFTLSACGGNKYRIDISDMPQEMKAQEEQKLADALELYKEEAPDTLAKIDRIAEVGFRYMALGQYDNAIPYYEEVLELDPNHVPALNNLADMYEEVGEIEQALEYAVRLHESDPGWTEGVRDLVRLYTENSQPEEASRLLEEFAKTENGLSSTEFIEEQRAYIEKQATK